MILAWTAAAFAADPEPPPAPAPEAAAPAPVEAPSPAPVEAPSPAPADVPMTLPEAPAPAWSVPPLPATSLPNPHRSRTLILAGLGAGVASAGLLGGAAALKADYLDTKVGQAEKSTYDANRVLGHAGYASAIAGGALVLGSVSLGEW